MSDAIHCDRDGCETWSRKPEYHGFINVSPWGDWSEKRDFCSWDCVIEYGATKAPLTVVRND